MNLTLLSNTPLPLLLTASSLVILLTFFLFGFILPAWREGWRLGRVLRTLEGKELRDAKDPQTLDRAFPKSGEVAHLWQEYKNALYAVQSTGDDGIGQARWVSTAPAEAIWNGQIAVDQRVRSEFFKHLPGMFTGIGIIGTFFGLINGLKNFKVVSNAEIVRISLETLMHSVGDAFSISAIAISLAIFVTFIEKLTLTSLYGKVDAIAASLDRRFPAAVSEKFLEATANHTEEAATQLKHLKTDLIGDLKPILQELLSAQMQSHERLIGRQIEANQENTQALGATISGAISESFTGPLDEIRQAVQQATGDQSSAAVDMLQDVMASFSQKLNDLFGGQISGINELNERAGRSMQDAVLKLDELVTSLRDAGKTSATAMAEQMSSAISAIEARQAEMAKSTNALVEELRRTIDDAQKTTSESLRSNTDEMARRMAEAIEKMDSRQDSINERTREFVEQMRSLVASSQNETNAKLKTTIDTLGEQLGVMLSDLRAAQNDSMEASRKREGDLKESTQTSITALTSSVEEFVKEIAVASSKMEENIAAIRAVTTAAISGMNEGASQVNSAARTFAAASDSVSELMKQAANMSTQLSGLTTSLTGSASSLERSIDDYKLHRDAVSKLIADLNAIVANAKADVSITSDVLKRIEAASQELGKAQLQTEQFMAGVAKVLGEAHQAFREAMISTVRENNHEFQQKLSASVALLGTSIKDLEDVLSSVPR